MPTFEQELGLDRRHAEIGDVWLDVSIRETHSLQAEVSEHPVEQGSNIADHVRPLPRTITIEGLVTNHPLELPLSHVGNARVSGAAIELTAASNPLPRIAPNSIQIEGEPSVGALGIIPGVDQGVAILGALKIDVRSKQRFAAEQFNVDRRATTSYSAQALHFTEPFNRVTAVWEALEEIVESSKLVTVVTGLRIYHQVALTDLSTERSGQIGHDLLKFTATGRVLRLVKSETVKLPDDPRAKGSKSRGKQSTEAQAAVPAAAAEVINISFLRKLLDGDF